MAETTRSNRWEDRNRALKKFKYFGRSGWMHLIVAERKIDQHRFLRLRRFYNWYNVQSPADLVKTINLLKAGAKELNWDFPYERISKSEGTELLDKDPKLVRTLVENVGHYRDQYIKNRVPEFKKILEDFKKLVKEKKPESSYQKFLKENFWIFGLEYVGAKSQKRAGADNIPDFSLERYDKFRDIVEIKKPHDNVFVKTNKRVHQSKKLKEALAEVMDYVDYFLKHENDEAVEHGETYYKPKAIIVLGHNQGYAEKVRQLNSFLHRIEILTYDDLIERAQKIIDFYEGKKRTRK